MFDPRAKAEAEDAPPAWDYPPGNDDGTPQMYDIPAIPAFKAGLHRGKEYTDQDLEDIARLPVDDDIGRQNHIEVLDHGRQL